MGGTLDAPTIWHNGSNTMWYAVLTLVPNADRVIVAITNVVDIQRIDRLMQSLIETP